MDGVKLTQVLFEWVLTSAFLILAVVLLRALLGKRVSAGLRYALWAVVLVRLLVPVQLFTTPVTGTSVLRETGVEQFVAPPPVDLVPAPAQSFAPPEPTELPDGTLIVYQPATEPVAVRQEPLTALQALGWLWLAGSVAMAAAFIVSNVGFARRLRRVRTPLEGVDCPLPAYLAPSLPSPCLFGLVRPAVYITPETAADPTALRHVLAHEHTHFCHGDHVWNVLRSVALAVHWWNPLVWLAVVFSRRDCELACDEGALKRLGDGERVAYGRTLLLLLTRKPRPGDLLTCATTMTGGQRSVFERITRIARAPKRLLWATAVMVLAAALACVCAFGAAAEPEEDPAEPSPEPSASASPEPEESAPAAETVPPRIPPAVNFHPTVFGDDLDFEFFDMYSKCAVRFSNLTWVIASTTEFAFQVEQYAILDLDRDGQTELVLEMEGQGGFYVFRKMDKWLYGFHEVPRGMMDLKADGTFGISSGAANWGFCRVTDFNVEGMLHEPFTWCESGENYEELYFVDGVPATRWEFEAATAAQDAKEDAPWQPWTGPRGYPEEAKAWLDPAVTEWLGPVETPKVTAMAGVENWQLSYQGKQTRFSGGENWNGIGPPTAYLMDLDKDGRDEIAITLVDPDVPTEELYLFDAETLEQYDTTGVADMVRGYLTTTSDPTCFYLSAPEFGFEVTIPRGRMVSLENKLRDDLEIPAFAYFPLYLDDGRIVCSLNIPAGNIHALLNLEGKELVCTGFEYQEYPRMGTQDTFADVLLWGVPFSYMEDGRFQEHIDAADIPKLFGGDDPYMAIQRFAVVDLDQDGVDEMVLYVCGVAGDMGGYLVLYQNGNWITGFKSDWRSFWKLKTDGTLSWSSPTGQDNGWGAYPDLYYGDWEMKELSRMHSSWGEPDAAFSIGGEDVTEEEYRDYDQRQRAKPDVVWHEYSRENVLEALGL